MRRIAVMLLACAGAILPGTAAAQTADKPDALAPAFLPAPPAPPPPPPAPPRPHSLAGEAVYVYSFLDVREELFTPKVLEQIDLDLTNALAASNVRSTILRSQDTPTGKVFATTLPASGYSQVPVPQVIFENHAKEAATNSRYRLVIFPSNFETRGAWRFYDIRWVLFDARTDQLVWEHTYSGKHMVMWRESENKAARSVKILKAFFAELRKAKLISPTPP